MKSLWLLDELITSEDLLGFAEIDQYVIEHLDEINEYLRKKQFAPTLKVELTSALDYLFLDNIPYYQKQLLLQRYFQFGFMNSRGYFLALFSGNYKNYRNIPKILEALIKKLNITKYQNLTSEDIEKEFYKYFTLKTDHVKKLDLDVNDTFIVEAINRSTYGDYEDVECENEGDVVNWKKFFVWGEKEAYKKELAENSYENVFWASKFVGDGLGYDILSYDKYTHREKLIEVKTGLKSSFTLTENEYQTMLTAHQNNADYYVYKYGFRNIIVFNRYHYDYTRNALVDLFGIEYDLEPTEYTSKGPQTRYEIVKRPQQKVLQKK